MSKTYYTIITAPNIRDNRGDIADEVRQKAALERLAKVNNWMPSGAVSQERSLVHMYFNGRAMVAVLLNPMSAAQNLLNRDVTICWAEEKLIVRRGDPEQLATMRNYCKQYAQSEPRRFAAAQKPLAAFMLGCYNQNLEPDHFCDAARMAGCADNNKIRSIYTLYKTITNTNAPEIIAQIMTVVNDRTQWSAATVEEFLRAYDYCAQSTYTETDSSSEPSIGGILNSE